MRCEDSSFSPNLYKLTFSFEKTEFQGTLLLQLDINKRINELTFHASPKLTFGKSCSIVMDKKSISFQIKREMSQVPIKNSKKFEDKPGDQIILSANDYLAPGRAELKIGWKGEVSKESFGIFTAKGGIYTHFEPNFARHAFPCIDTFSAKAQFEVTLITPESNHLFISNMRIKTISRKKTNTVVFERTPILSPYLLAFAFGEFRELLQDSFESMNQSNLPLAIYCPSTTFTYPSVLIMDNVQKALKLLEIEFQLPISETGLKKLDIVIVPNLCFGGMENHGCIFLNESATQFKKTEMEPFVELVVHEVAHQWIGNFVSCDMWIKEGLAQYYEKIITDSILKRKPHVFLKREEKDVPKSSIDIQTYNGVNYSKSMNFIVEKVTKIGTDKFKTILQQILQEYAYSYLPEEEFIKKLHN
jgi:aminopeptidase N